MEKTIEKIAFSKLPQIKLLKVAAYCRVSTGKETMLHSLSEQISYYSQRIQQHKDWVYCGVYADEAVSGTKNNRENYLRLLKDCREGKVDLVITKSISRFARNTVTLLETVRELKSMGVGVYFEEQNINSLTADGELMLTILASYAQEEARSASENVKWRFKKDFEQGILPMCIKYVYGYERTSGGDMVIIPGEAETVRLIFSLFLKGFGISKIARILTDMNNFCRTGKRWSEHSVRYILSNERYVGDLRLQKSYSTDFLTKKRKLNRGEKTQYYVKDNHVPIVSRKSFEMVQQEFERRCNKFRPAKEVKEYAFTHKIQCGICGKYYQRKISKGKVYWACGTFDRYGKTECPSKQIPEDILKKHIVALLGKFEFDAEDFALKIKKVFAYKENRLCFIFADGHEEERVWQHLSRSQSWTPEMKEKARQKALERRKNNVENNHRNTCEN